jgi:hypothetical protein
MSEVPITAILIPVSMCGQGGGTRLDGRDPIAGASVSLAYLGGLIYARGDCGFPSACGRPAAHVRTMLFKTQSASVYGIDAYLVEVEVDVGSARMQDFNVVGLPDNAVKESRERIKSALRNCGFEFPHGQGVTINLAPADVRKEGSGFDLPMALGLVGCQGQFFGKQLDKMMFLGELSLDGSVRSVRGALSAALAAREFGLKALAVPEANAKEAGKGGCAADALRGRAVLRGLARRAWPAVREARAGSGVRGRAQHLVYWTAGCGENHAGEAHPDDPAADVA